MKISGAMFSGFPAENSSYFPPRLQFFLSSFLLDSVSELIQILEYGNVTLKNLFSWYTFVALPPILKCIRKARRVDEGWGVLPNCWIFQFFSDLENILIQWGARINQVVTMVGSRSWNIHSLWLTWCMYDATLFMLDTLNMGFKNYTWDGTHFKCFICFFTVFFHL